MFAAASVLTGAAQGIDTAPEGYTLRWSDEFNSPTLNEAI